MRSHLLGGLLLGALLPISACAPGDDDTVADVPVEADGDGDEADVFTGALVPVAPPVEVYLTDEFTLGPVLLTSLSGAASVIWGERDGAAGAWSGPGFAMVGSDGAVATAAVHLPDSGHEPIGLEPHAALNQLAYFTLQRGTGCEATLHRRMLDTAGRLTGSITAVDTLDDPLAVHLSSINGNAVALVVEGSACTAREYPAARTVIVGTSGTATGSVPLGDAERISALTARSGGAGYLSFRYNPDVGMVLDTLGPGGGLDRSWAIVRRDGTCECPSSRGVVATAGAEYLVAWAGAVDGMQSWYLHRGAYFDEIEFGADPLVIPLAAQFDKTVALAPFGEGYVVAYVPSDGSAALRVDLLGADGVLQTGWAPDVPGQVGAVAVASIGTRVAVGWIEIWAGATAPELLKVGLFERR